MKVLHLYYCSHLHQQVRFTALKYTQLWKTVADFGRSKYLTVEETHACGWCCRQQAGRASVWFTVSKISPVAASAPLGFQPFIPGQNKRGLCVQGTIGVVAKASSIGRGNYCLIFLIAKSPLVIIQWLSGKSYDCRVFLFVYPSFRSTLGFDTGAGNALWEHWPWPAIRRTSQICHIAVPLSPCCMSLYVRCFICQT